MLCCDTIGNVFRLAIIGGSVAALIFQYYTVTSCDFLTLATDGDASQLPAASVGIFFFEDTQGVCSTEQAFDPQGDGYITGARNALVLSMIFGFGALCLVTFEWICCKICCAGCIEGLAFAAAWILGCGVYMIIGTDGCGTVGDADDTSITDAVPGIQDIPTGVNCEWSEGATYNLLACILYFGCGLLLCCTPQPEPLCKQASK